MKFIRLLVKNAPDAGINQDFQAVYAGRMVDINIGTTDIRAIFCGLGNGVDFGVDRPLAVLFYFPCWGF